MASVEETDINIRRKPTAPQTTACIIVLESQFSSGDGRVHPLVKDQTIVGRDTDADIRLIDSGVSRRHAKFVRHGDDIILVDLGSRNGSRVNGVASEQRRLASGDKVQLGSVATLKYVVQDSLEVKCAYLLEQARESIRMRDEFLSIASHELKTPLTALHLQTQALKRSIRAQSEVDVATLKTRLSMLERQTQRLNGLISQLLDVSRVRVGKLELHKEPVDLVALVQDVLTTHQEELGQAGCQVILQAESRPMGMWDRTRIEQVFTNLLANARKYGRDKPIHIRVEQDSENAKLVVRDEGIGIDPESQLRIFERFERAASSSHYGGLGLGLYIVRTIVGGHGGKIDVESEPGRGSTFTVQLPLFRPS